MTPARVRYSRAAACWPDRSRRGDQAAVADGAREVKRRGHCGADLDDPAGTDRASQHGEQNPGLGGDDGDTVALAVGAGLGQYGVGGGHQAGQVCLNRWSQNGRHAGGT